MGDRIKVVITDEEHQGETGYIDGYIFVPYQGTMAIIIQDKMLIQIHIDKLEII